MQQLRSFHIIHKNHKNEVTVIWTFPNISEEHKNVMIRKAFSSRERNPFNCLRCTDWLYLHAFEINQRQFSICLITTEYDTDKYETLCRILIKKYEKTENPTELVKLYLAVFTQGCLSIQENGTIISHNFKLSKSVSNLKEMIPAFGLEIILIYSSLLLKKRMLVYHSNLKKLQTALLSITKIMEHRNLNDYLYPNVDDISDIKNKSFFVAGTTSNKPFLNPDSYDLFVNMNSHKIAISSHAKETFAMNKTHKELAMFMVQLAEDSSTTEVEVVREIGAKTRELLTNLRGLASVKVSEGKSVITLESLRSKKLNPVTENFLFNLAVAENIMML